MNPRTFITNLLCVGIKETDYTRSLLQQQNPFSIKRGGLGYGIHAYVHNNSDKKLCNVRISTEENKTSYMNEKNKIFSLIYSYKHSNDKANCKYSDSWDGYLEILPTPKWYYKKTSQNKEVGKVIQRHMLTHLVTVVGDTSCLLKRIGKGCNFCEFGNETNTSVEYSINEIIECLELIFTEDMYSRITLSVPILEDNEIKNIALGIKKIKNKFPSLQIAIEIQPINSELALILKESGCNTLIIPLDVYSQEAQNKWIPGKVFLIKNVFWPNISKYVKIFGLGNVVSNIIAGIEPGWETVKAIDLLIDSGILPDLVPIRKNNISVDGNIFMELQDHIKSKWSLINSKIKPNTGCITCGGCSGSFFTF